MSDSILFSFLIDFSIILSSINTVSLSEAWNSMSTSHLIHEKQSLIKSLNNKMFSRVFNISTKIKLNEILIERKECEEKGKNYEHASLTKKGVVPKTEQFNRDFLVRDKDKKYKICRYDDIAYNPANLKYGVITRNKYKDIIFSPIYVTFKVRDSYNAHYIELIMTSKNFMNRALQYQQGSIYERMAVSPKDLLSIKVPTPNIEIQNKISYIIKNIEAAYDNSCKTCNELLLLKKHFLDKFFI